MKIRRADVGDVERFYEHMMRHFDESGNGDIHFFPILNHEAWVKAEFIHKMQAKMSTPIHQVGWGAFWILEKGDRIVGHVNLRSANMEASLHRAVLSMGIEREARHQGFGKRLGQAAIQWARELEQIEWIDLYVFEHNQPARALYRSLGFLEVGKAQDLFWVRGYSISDIHMSLHLRTSQNRWSPPIHSIQDSDREEVRQFIIKHWGAEHCTSHGVLYLPHTLPGFVCRIENEIVGLITLSIANLACEIITLNNTSAIRGVGTALIQAAKQAATEAKCRKLWLLANNDNLDAIRFYQKRGFRMVAIHRDAVVEARKLKPQIPLIGNGGIPILDEVELVLTL